MAPRDALPAGTTRETRSTCPYCGVGCGVVIESRGDEITGVRGDPDHPANFGRLCTKGSTLHLSARPAITAQVRALHPQFRTRRDAPRERHDWETVLDFVADRVARTVCSHGPDSIGLYASGQLLTEDYYVFNKLAKGLLGTNNIDTNSRLCMSSAVAGYKMTLGADSVPACYEDIDYADLLFIAGSNTAYAHPIVFRRIEEARARNPRQKMIVVDPRATDTAKTADLHLQIVPGTDVALFHGLLHLLLWDDRIDRAYVDAHTEGFAELKPLVRDYPPKRVAELCGIREGDLVRAAAWWGESGAVLSLYCQGLNQSTSGTAKNVALINLHLATGQIGRRGAGPLSLTGQPNAMGGREVGGMANLLSAHRDLSNAAHRAEVARLWGVDRVPSQPGKSAVEMFEAAADGEIKLLWIVCTNPAQSLPNQRVVRAALERAECVIVQDAYATTATASYADVLLPAASWGEKEGTVTNSERRIARVRRAVAAPGEAREDWAIAVDVAHRLETRLRPGKPTLFPYASVAQVWDEHRESTRGRDLDITGLSYAILDAHGPQFWPFPARAAEGKPRLYGDGVFPTASGKARFAARPYRPCAESIDARFPLRLNTGRLRDQWHGMSRTGTVGRLFGHAPEPCVQMHPSDLARRGLVQGELVHVTSRRGSIVLPLAASEELRAGEVFIAMHWGDEFVAGTVDERQASFGVNTLTIDACDPLSKQPELKHAAVNILQAPLPWRYVACGRVPQDRQAALQSDLRRHFDAFGYAACMPFGFDEANGGVLFRGAAAAPVAADVLAAIEQRFGLASPGTLRYEDARRGLRRRVQIAGDRVTAVALAGGDDRRGGEAWLRELFEGDPPAATAGRALLHPARREAAAAPRRDHIVCSCFNVSESQIDAVAAAGPKDAPGALSAIQSQLRCGTHCGSCLPELKRRIATLRARQDPQDAALTTQTERVA